LNLGELKLLNGQKYIYNKYFYLNLYKTIKEEGKRSEIRLYSAETLQNFMQP